MGRYLVQRLALGLISLLILASICFALLRYLPGGPFSEDEALHPLVRAHFEKSLGLHDPVMIQFKNYIAALFQGDFGQSYQSPGLPVLELLSDRFAVTSRLAGMAFLISLFGIFLFAYVVTRSPSLEKWGTRLALLGFALPGLVLAPLLVDIFALRLGLFPVARLESHWGYVLPLVAMSLRPSLRLGQILALEIQRLRKSDSARTARSLGFSEKRISFYWVLPEASIAVIAQLGTLFAQLLAGSFFVEVVFSVPGLGQLFADSLVARDYPVVLGVVLWTGTLALLCQLIVDLLLVRIDPRISLTRGET